jgi:hypothetical protein
VERSVGNLKMEYKIKLIKVRPFLVAVRMYVITNSGRKYWQFIFRLLMIPRGTMKLFCFLHLTDK